MNIKQKIKDFFSSDSVKSLGKEKSFTGSGFDGRYAAERRIEDAKTQQASDRLVEISTEAIRYRKRAKDAEKKLDAAADVFRQIECITADEDILFEDDVEAIHVKAQTAYRAVTK